MTISRVKPAGWALNEKLTSAQATQLDINIASAVDKTVAGDTIAGVLAFASGAGWTLNSGATATIGSGAVLSTSGTGYISIATSGGLVVQNGALLQVATGGVLGVYGLIKTVSGGRIQLADNDYPTFSVTRNISRAYAVASLTMPSTFTGWTLGADGLLSTAGAASIDFYLPEYPLDGLTLASVDLYYTPTSSGDASTIGGTFGMYRRTSAIAAGATIPGWTLLGGSSASVVATSLNVVNKITVSPGVAMSGTDQCKFHISDLHGGAYAGGTTFHQIVLNYTASAMIMP